MNVVMSCVLEHVGERVADFARRTQVMHVVAVVEDGATPAPESVEPARDAHAEALHAASEGA